MIYRLPRADSYGNYWLGNRPKCETDGPAGPALFSSRVLKNGRWQTACYILFLGDAKGFVFSGPLLRRYATAADALADLNRLED